MNYWICTHLYKDTDQQLVFIKIDVAPTLCNVKKVWRPTVIIIILLQLNTLITYLYNNINLWTLKKNIKMIRSKKYYK